MQTFRGQTRTWELSLSIRDAARIKAHLAMDLLKADQPDGDQQIPVLQFYTDPELLIRCVALLAETQLREHFAAQLSAQTETSTTLLDLFVSELGDGVYEQMRDAFLAELRDFFHRLGLAPRAAVIGKQIEAIQQSQCDTARQIETLQIEGRLPTVDVQQMLDESIPGNTSNSSPPCPVSMTPAA